jgi:hypothetical protein
MGKKQPAVFTYPAAYPNAAWNLSQMVSGTGIGSDIESTTTKTAATFTYLGFPVSTKT